MTAPLATSDQWAIFGGLIDNDSPLATSDQWAIFGGLLDNDSPLATACQWTICGMLPVPLRNLPEECRYLLPFVK